jgi:hypothetical protein
MLGRRQSRTRTIGIGHKRLGGRRWSGATG